MKKFIEWIEKNYPYFLSEQEQRPPFFAASSNNPEQIYSPNEIIIKKQVIPKNLIRSAQPNPEKWDVDYQNLKKPGIPPSKYHLGPQPEDIGFATHKEFFEKPVTMYVVKQDAIQRNYKVNAYASFKNRYVVISNTAFEVLPTATSDGKLTKEGANTLAHELRHTTQKGEVPINRNVTAQQDIKSTEGWQKYMHDPNEMGVRLAALKNILTKKTFDDILKGYEYLYADNNKSNILNSVRILVNSLPYNNEKMMLDFILNPNKWAEYALKNLK